MFQHNCISPAGIINLQIYNFGGYFICGLSCKQCYKNLTICHKSNKRFVLNRTDAKNSSKHEDLCEVLCDGFNNVECKRVKYQVQIIEKLETNGRNQCGEIGWSKRKIRKAKETGWI